MKRQKFIKWLGLFFGAMLVLTVVSRAADSMNTAKVQVKSMQNYVISHTVSGSGKVEGTRELAVFAREGQRVEQVLVGEGQAVKKGELLLKLSMEILEEGIEKKNGELEELNLQARDLESAGSVNGEKKSQASYWAKQNYNMAASSGSYNISSAQDALNQARQRLSEYYDSLGFTSEPDTSGQEQALLDDVSAKQDALNQAIMARDQALMEAQKGISEAQQSEASDGTLENVQRQIRTKNKELEDLLQLKEQGGEITAPSDGVVKSIAVATGGLTGEDAALVLYETSGELRMTASISEEEAKYVEAGANATIVGISGTEVENARIESIREDESDPDRRKVSFVIPQDTLSIGESAEFTISRDEGPFTTCIPLSALYGETGKEYVLVLDTQDTVLGTVQVLRKVSVTVKDKNENYAALAEGSLTSEQKVVTGADRFVEEGSRVRLEE